MKIIGIPKDTEALLDRLEKGGFPSYVVGGCVRDMLMGKLPSDYDVCTPALPEQVMALFSDCTVIPTGIKHGTVTVLWQGVPYEITTYRSDGDYADHRHPLCVSYSESVENDLSRRDFTVNAMCFHPKQGIVDLFGGRVDIEAKLLRCVGNAEKRFSEDALRILRCLRFASRLGFTIEPQTAKAMYACLPLTKTLSAERVYTELKGILTAEQKYVTVEKYYDILLYILGLNEEAISKKKVMQALKSVDCKYGFAVFVALVSSDVSVLMNRLRADNDTKCFCEGVALCKIGFGTALETAKYIRLYGIEAVRLAIDLCALLGTPQSDAAAIADAIGAGKLPLSVKDLAVTGKELMTLGFEGEEIGQVQELLFLKVYNGTNNEKTVLLAEARKIYDKKGELL